MNGLATAIWTAACVFEVLALLIRTRDVLRMAPMVQLASLLALISLAPGPGPAISAACALTLGVTHPQLHHKPFLSVQFLLLTPSIIAMAAFWPILFDFGLAPRGAGLGTWVWATAPLAVLLCTIGVRGMTAAPHVRFAAIWGFAIWLIVTLYAAAGGSPWAWICVAVPFLASAYLPGPSNMSGRRLRWIQGAGIALAAPFASMAAQAGPWTQETGNSLAILRGATETSTSRPAPAFTVYQEYGIAPDATLVTSTFQDVAGAKSRVGGDVSVRHALLRDGAWIVSVEAGAGFQPITVPEFAKDFEGHAQGELKALAGWSGDWDGVPIYVATSMEAAVRTGDLPIGFTVSGESGVEVTPGLKANLSVAWKEIQDARSQVFAQAGMVWSLDDAFALELGVQTSDISARDPDVQAYAGVWVRF